MIERNAVYRRVSPDREFAHNEHVLVVDHDEKEVMAHLCTAEGDAFDQQPLRIARHVFIQRYDLLGASA